MKEKTNDNISYVLDSIKDNATELYLSRCYRLGEM